MSVLLVLALFAAVLGLAYAAFNFVSVKAMDEGTAAMQEIDLPPNSCTSPRVS